MRTAVRDARNARLTSRLAGAVRDVSQGECLFNPNCNLKHKLENCVNLLSLPQNVINFSVGFMKLIISTPSSSSSSSSEAAAEEDDDDGCHYVTTTSSSNTFQHREPLTLGSRRRSGTHLGLPSPPLPHTLASSLVASTACTVSERLSNGHELQLGPR